MYKSPIEVFITDIQHQIEKQQEDEIYKAVVNVGINVDKEELIRALQDDRRQYEEGYRDGRLSAIEEIVRCKDCKFATAHPFEVNSQNIVCTKPINWRTVEPGHFCSYGERRDNERKAD